MTIHSIPDELRDRVIYKLSEEGFESFSEEGNIVKGYVQTGKINERDIESFLNGCFVGGAFGLSNINLAVQFVGDQINVKHTHLIRVQSRGRGMSTTPICFQI